MCDSANPLILLTGATGYVGGRLLRALEARELPVRCFVRRPEALANRIAPTTALHTGSVLDYEALASALRGVHTAFYLIHNLGDGVDFEAIEERSAANFAAAAKENGVQRIVYLGGLCDDSEASLSPHLRSRLRVGEVLRESDVPTVEFRASIIIGSGSLSFELIRALVHRLPVMVTPRWVSVKAQPIGISDTIAYLLAGLDLPHGKHGVYEIGGPDQMSYGDLIQAYARARGLKRLLIKVPFLTPRLSSLWLNLVTPIYSRVGRKLVDSMTVPSVVRDKNALKDFPIKPLPVAQAIALALKNEDQDYAETYWADALSMIGPANAWGGRMFGNRIVDCRTLHVATTPQHAFAPIQRIGGPTGWYYANWLWKIRGAVDRLLGGVGMGRGRRDAESLRAGDVVDCWRVESIEPPRRLILAAEMKLPGRAWLKYELKPDSEGTLITQTAIYDPIGLSGLAYWYALYVIHHFVFSGMLRNIGAATLGQKDEAKMSRQTPSSNREGGP